MTQSQENQTELEIINPAEGVSLTAQSMAIIETLRYDESAMPLLLQALQTLAPEKIEAAFNDYDGAIPRDWKSVAGREEKVLGMRLFQHAPFNGKDGQYHADGFYQMQILLDKKDEDGQNIVIKSSSANLLTHIASIIKMRGWYYFETPQTYIFKVGANNEHILYNVSIGHRKVAK